LKKEVSPFAESFDRGAVTMSHWWGLAAGAVVGLFLVGSCTTEPCACEPTFEAVTVVSGNQQQGVPGQALAVPIVVRADRQHPNAAALSGHNIYFIPQPGSGSVSSSPVTTDADGLAQVIWTLGPDAGEDTLMVHLDFPTPSYSSAVVTATVP
jgi:hypothetical protein